jgi:hypothetical protein
MVQPGFRSLLRQSCISTAQNRQTAAACISPIVKEAIIRKDENGRERRRLRISELRGHFRKRLAR